MKRFLSRRNNIREKKKRKALSGNNTDENTCKHIDKDLRSTADIIERCCAVVDVSLFLQLLAEGNDKVGDMEFGGWISPEMAKSIMLCLCQSPFLNTEWLKKAFQLFKTGDNFTQIGRASGRDRV